MNLEVCLRALHALLQWACVIFFSDFWCACKHIVSTSENRWFAAIEVSTYTPDLVLCQWGILLQLAAGSACDGLGQCLSHSMSYKHTSKWIKKCRAGIFSWGAATSYIVWNPKYSSVASSTHHSLAMIRSGASKSWRPEGKTEKNREEFRWVRTTEINTDEMKHRRKTYLPQQRHFLWRYTVHIPALTLYPDCQHRKENIILLCIICKYLKR